MMWFKRYRILILVFAVLLFNWLFIPRTLGITLTKSSYTAGEDIITSSSGGPWVIYNVTTGQPITGRGRHDLGDDISFGGGLGSYSVIETTEDGACEDAGYNYTQCKTSAYFVNEATFTITESGGGGSAGAGGASGSNLAPRIQIKSPRDITIATTDELTIDYDANDPNGLVTSLGLAKNPVSLYYASADNLYDRKLIAETLPRGKGSYLWQIPSLKEGSYYIIAAVEDRPGAKDEDVSPEIIIDRAAPSFAVTTEPEFVGLAGEIVNIAVDASEKLQTKPKITVRQRGGPAVDLPAKGQDDHFWGTYQVRNGFDGRAEIKIIGVDLVGNQGELITAGGFFSVGLKPPPKPVITTPLDNELTATSTIIVSGGNVRNDTKLRLVVNGADEYQSSVNPDGSFRFDKAVISRTFNKGLNNLRVISTDLAGNSSETTVRVKFNLAPEVTFFSPRAGAAIGGASSTVSVLGTDANNDALRYRYEIKRETAKSWTRLADGLALGRYQLDTTAWPDGDYRLRVTASDGFAEAVATSSVFSIANGLPVITFDEPSQAIANKSSLAISGRVESPKREVFTANGGTKIVQASLAGEIEYSLDNGQTWRSQATAGSAFRRQFNIALSGLTERAYALTVRAANDRGLYGRASQTIIIDFGPPAAPAVLAPAAGKIFGQADDEDPKTAGVQITLTGRAEPQTTVTVDNAGNKTSATTDALGRFAVQATLKARGENQLRLTVVDPAGNASPAAKLALVYNNPPQITFINPRAGRGVGASATVEWEIRDADLDPVTVTNLGFRPGTSGPYQILAKNLKSNAYQWSAGDLAEGYYQLKLEASDKYATTVEVVNFVVDQTPPTVDLEPWPQTVFTQALTLRSRGAARDDFSGITAVEYSLDGEIWQKALITKGFLEKLAGFEIRHPTALDDGRYDFQVRAVDASNNRSKPVGRRFVVDLRPPRLGSFMLSQGRLALQPRLTGELETVTGSKLDFKISLEADTAQAALSLDGQTLPLSKNRIGLWETAIQPLSVGEFDLTVTATDQLGNVTPGSVIGRLKITPSGRVYDRESPSQLPLAGAEILVRVWDETRQVFVNWSGEEFGQTNPVVTDAAGHYQLTLPAGRYELIVSRRGFDRLKTEPLILDRPISLNLDFGLRPGGGLGRWINQWFK